jgi:uncharacterized membrane protein
MDDYEDDSYYETDIEDLPDNQLSENVSTDLSKLNNEIEEQIEMPKKLITKNYDIPHLDIKDTVKEFVVLFVVVFTLTNKSIISAIMNIPFLTNYKKTLIFNVILGVMIAITFIIVKKVINIISN